MSKFHKLKVAEIRKETAESVSVAFQIPDALKNEYKFIQGQYITLKLTVNGEEIRRSYSLCSSPFEKDFRVAIKRVKDGRGSSFINTHLKTGDEVEVMTPMGTFHSPLNASNKKNYILFAGGSGITPMMSIIKSVLYTEPQSNITLFYGNENEAAIIFKDELQKLAEQNNQLKVYHILNQPSGSTPELHKGMLTVEKNKALIENYVGLNNQNEYFVCGPSIMMDNVNKVLEELKVDKHTIHIEYFSSPVEHGKPQTNTTQFVRSQVTIVCDGDEKTIVMEPGEIVLDAAIKAGFDAPFACRGGSCCTCRAKLLSGKVVMDVNYALLDSEVEEGFILTCQSHPITETIVVDYDKGR